MTKAKKICFTMIIMLIIAMILVCVVNIFFRDDKETYEGILVRESMIEEGVDEIEYHILES